MKRRLAGTVAVVVLLYVAAVAARTGAAALCAPAPLPGETAYMFSGWLRDALVPQTLLLDAGACFTRSTFGAALAGATPWLARGSAATLVLGLFWTWLGSWLRLVFTRLRGGHLIAIVEGMDAGLIRKASPRPVVFLGSEKRHDHGDLQVSFSGDEDGMRRALRRAGGHRAGQVLLAGPNDSLNAALGRAALVALSGPSSSPPVSVRLEDPLVADTVGRDLVDRADEAGIRLGIFSTQRYRIRRGLERGSPAKVRSLEENRVHIVVFGSGPLLAQLANAVMRRGYGLEQTPPKISIIALGANALAEPELERLRARPAAEVTVRTFADADVAGIDQEIAGRLVGPDAVRVVHLCARTPGAARAAAMRWHSQSRWLGVPMPRLVVYEDDEPPGPPRAEGPGDMQVVPPIPALDGEAVANGMDRRARLLHERYLESQRPVRGEAFGERPSERPWSRLSNAFREENIEAADGLDYLVACGGGVSQPGPEQSRIEWTDAELDHLAAIEHARWMANRYFLGWRHGEKRDDDARLHPDLVPFDQLDEATRDKDRMNVRLAPELLAATGDGVARRLIWGVTPAAAAAGEPGVLVRAVAERAEREHRIPTLAFDTASAAECALARYAREVQHRLAAVRTGVAEIIEHDSDRLLAGAELVYLGSRDGGAADWRARVCDLLVVADGESGAADAETVCLPLSQPGET